MTKLQLDRAMFSFIEKFAFSENDPKCQILKGYQNYNASRAKDSLIFTRIGVNGKEEGMRGFHYNAEKDAAEWISANLRYNVYQIMSSGIDDGSEWVAQRLARLHEAFRSSLGANWWKQNTMDAFGGAAPISVGQTMDQTTQGEQGAWELTYTADFTVAARMELAISQDFATDIDPGIHLVNAPI